jgi:hypothetical protein
VAERVQTNGLPALPSEGPEETDFEDFVVWVYPQKIVATKEHEKIVRDLIEWQSRDEE